MITPSGNGVFAGWFATRRKYRQNERAIATACESCVLWGIREKCAIIQPVISVEKPPETLLFAQNEAAIRAVSHSKTACVAV